MLPTIAESKRRIMEWRYYARETSRTFGSYIECCPLNYSGSVDLRADIDRETSRRQAYADLADFIVKYCVKVEVNP